MHRKLNWIDSHGLDSTATTTPCQEVDYSEKKDSRLEILFLSRSRAEFVLSTAAGSSTGHVLRVAGLVS